MFEHSARRPRVQTASRDPANVNALKNMCDPYNVNYIWHPLNWQYNRPIISDWKYHPVYIDKHFLGTWTLTVLHNNTTGT